MKLSNWNYFGGLYNGLYSSVNRDHGACLTFLHNSKQIYQYVTQSREAEEHVSESDKWISWYRFYFIPENYRIGKLWVSSTGFVDFLFTTYSSPKVEKGEKEEMGWQPRKYKVKEEHRDGRSQMCRWAYFTIVCLHTWKLQEINETGRSFVYGYFRDCL